MEKNQIVNFYLKVSTAITIIPTAITSKIQLDPLYRALDLQSPLSPLGAKRGIGGNGRKNGNQTFAIKFSKMFLPCFVILGLPSVGQEIVNPWQTTV